MQKIQIKKGLDVPISGVPTQQIEDGPDIHHVALIGPDYIGMKPTLAVQVGDHVQTGQLLFEDKKTPGVLYTSPGCGTVKAINRGAKRAFQSLIIELDGEEAATFEQQPEIAALTRNQVRELLVQSGQWTAFRARPFSKVPSPETTPHSIFIQAIDTNPLAANPKIVITEQETSFLHGLQIVRLLTDGCVYLCVPPGGDIPGSEVDGITMVQFDGPHPAGLPGTHIHFLDPVGLEKTVWTIGYQDIIAIGKLFATGRLWTERVISLAGPHVERPRLLRTRLGASVSEIAAGQTKPGDHRLISGSVLSGRTAAGPFDFLGRFHTQVSVLREDHEREFLGWQKPGTDKFSAKRVFVSGFAADGRRYDMTTNQHGSRRAIVPIGSFEQVMPLDILPTFLLKALLCHDTDQAQSLGALELDEEDIALCTFVDPGKNDFGPLLRENLTRIEREG